MQPDADTWDRFVETRSGHLLQCAAWGALKRAFGWRDQIVAVGQAGEISAGALLLTRPLPLGLGTIAYVPRGPVLRWDDAPAAAALLAALDDAARRARAVLLKIEPDARDAPALREQLAALGFRASPHTVQPPRTILIDITGPAGAVESDDDPVLMRMSQTTRRKVRTAYRKGVTVRRGETQADLDSFNALIRVTGARNAFGVHSPAYYQKVFDLFVPQRAVLLIASHAGRDLAGLFVFALGPTAWYLYGASSDAERQRMPAYALQWEAIRWARERGCRQYDLWGIPDADKPVLEAQFQSRQDGLWGVYGFKRGFGGEIVRSVGAWDRPYRPLLYQVYRAAAARRGGGE